MKLDMLKSTFSMGLSWPTARDCSCIGSQLLRREPCKRSSTYFALENLERVHVIFVQALVLAQLLVSLVVPYETS